MYDDPLTKIQWKYKNTLKIDDFQFLNCEKELERRIFNRIPKCVF